jgi:hypothetical protein
MLAPLAHDMTADGPAGLVSGIAVPLVQRQASGADPRPTSAVPAAAAADRARSRPRGTLTTVARLPMADGERATDDASDDRASAGPGDVVAGDAAEHDLPTVAPRVLPVARLAVPAAAITATRVADATAPAPIVARALPVAPEAAAGAAAMPAAPEPAPAAPAKSGPPAVTTTDPGATASADPPVGEPAAETGPARPGANAERGPVVVGRRSLGESRRLGLGAPLAGPPPWSVRASGGSEMPVARRAYASAAPISAPEPAASAPPVVAAAGTAAALPRLVVARRAVTLQGPGSAPDAADAGPTTDLSRAPHAAIAAEPSPAGGPADTVETTGSASPGGEAIPYGSGESRPLVGDLPLAVSRRAPGDAPADAEAGDAPADAEAGDAGRFGTVPLALAGLQRAPIDGSAGFGPAGDDGPAATAPVQRSPAVDTPAGSSQTVGGQPARGQPAFRDTPATVPLVAGRSMRPDLPRAVSTLSRAPLTDPFPAPLRFAIPAAAVTGGWSGWAPGAAVDVDRPAPWSAPAVALQREERATAARATPLAGRGSASATATALPLMRSSVGAAAPAGFPAALAAGGSDDAVEWSAATGFTSVAPQPGPFVQRAVQIDELNIAPAGQGAGGAGATPAGSASGPGGSSGAGGEGTDYEELAEQVYDKIRARLVTELLLDRERAGMLVDW